MIIRCKSCQGTVWVQPGAPGARKRSASCRRCGQRYELASESARGGQRFASQARQFARAEGLDLPGAYSVLLGLMTLAEVKDVIHAATHTRESGAGNDPSPRGRTGRYDPEFKSAVAEGLLSPRQARERGKRQAYASVVAGRYRISMNLALRVTDNRISVLEAMRQRDAASRTPLRAKQDRAGPLVSRRAVGLVATLALVIGLAFVMSSEETSIRTHYSKTTTVGEAELSTDVDGKVIQVTAGDPRTVLHTFCTAADPDGRHQAVDIVPLAMEGGRGRLGLIRDARDESVLLAITILEDRESGRWIAGDGRQPLIAQPAPDGASRRLR